MTLKVNPSLTIEQVRTHSFRKTWQTMGVNAGINQRSAQAILGHASAEMTAKAYTDVPSLELHREVSKLPWFGTPITSENHVSVSSSAPETLNGGLNWTRTSDPLRVKQVL